MGLSADGGVPACAQGPPRPRVPAGDAPVYKNASIWAGGFSMLTRAVFIACLACALAGTASSQPSSPQPPVTLKAAIVALADDPALRAEFERTLVAKARTHDYDAVTSFDLVP